MRILVATDAWDPQINGVVTTLKRVRREAESKGVEFTFVTPGDYRTVAMPGYGEIRLAMVGRRGLARRIAESGADFVHVATEGPIGLAARAACLEKGRRFTTSFHTRFPEYLAARLPVPPSWSYAALRRFHNAGAVTMVSTRSLERELAGRGFQRLGLWSRGVDADIFRPRPDEPSVFDLPRPIFLYVGRVAVEKNIGAFLDCDLPGSKVVVGDGPALASLRARHPGVLFTGPRTGEALARSFSSADAFVFPSRTDTFGLVLIEALASGLPVAAFPVEGPLDVIGDAPVGVLREDLREACVAALDLDREACRAHAMNYTWRRSAEQFLGNVTAA